MLQGYFHIMEYWPLKQNIFFLINTNRFYEFGGITLHEEDFLSRK